MDECQFMRILGIDFFEGSEKEAVDVLWQGGLAVAPSGPGLACDLVEAESYRDAVRSAKLVIPDSGAMVLVWNFIQPAICRLKRLSGLAFLRALFVDDRIRQRRSFWVMPSQEESRVNLEWLRTQGVDVAPECIYIAPKYVKGEGSEVCDPELLSQLERVKPDLVVLNVGGGIQEPLGGWLAANLTQAPGILCTGAALAFLTGKQAAIPPWADRFYLGWLLRTLRDPARFGSRYLKALPVIWFVLRYRDQMPPLRSPAKV